MTHARSAVTGSRRLAHRAHRVRPARRMRRDDAAVNEIIGFILMFAISSVILVFATQAYLQSQENTDHLLRGVELKNVAARVGTRVVQAGFVADEFPNATYTVLMRVPSMAADEPYVVTVDGETSTARSQRSASTATTTTYKLGAAQFLTVSGSASPDSGWLNVTYAHSWYATEADGPVRDDATGAFNKKSIFVTEE